MTAGHDTRGRPYRWSPFEGTYTHGALVSATLICPVCGKGKRARHDGGCWDCFPAVPPETPGAREIGWYVELGDGTGTAGRG